MLDDMLKKTQPRIPGLRRGRQVRGEEEVTTTSARSAASATARPQRAQLCCAS